MSNSPSALSCLKKESNQTLKVMKEICCIEVSFGGEEGVSFCHMLFRSLNLYAMVAAWPLDASSRNDGIASVPLNSVFPCFKFSSNSFPSLVLTLVVVLFRVEASKLPIAAKMEEGEEGVVFEAGYKKANAGAGGGTGVSLMLGVSLSILSV